MTEQPTGSTTGGIDQPLDAGLARDAEIDPDNPDDARSRTTVRTDPDDPIEGMKEASEASEEPSPH